MRPAATDRRATQSATGTVAPAPTDISTATHVHDLVVAFYREVVFDEVLEPVFGEVAEVDWTEHIPRLIEYWCWILLGAGRPVGSTTRAHRHLHEASPVEPLHCDRWFDLWVRSVDRGWRGPVAEKAKDHAATLMSSMAKHVFGFVWTRPAASTISGGAER